MNPTTVFKKNCTTIFFLLLIFSLPFFSQAQHLKKEDFILYGKKVLIASSSNITNGSVGALSSIQTTGTVSFGGSLYSDSAIILKNSNTVNGVVKANYSNGSSAKNSTAISIGSSAILKDSVIAKGNISISGGSVKQVFLPSDAIYSGPNPALGVSKVPANLLVLPVFPAMPTTIAINSTGTRNITRDTVITPDIYGNITLSGGKTITLSGTGTYVFNSIKNTGSFNTFIFDFKNTSGNFIILVKGDIDLNKNFATIVNGGGASYIFTEALGTGSLLNGNAFNIANGSSGGRNSEWKGSVWVPNGNMNVGTGSQYATITGALFSNNVINIQSNVTLDYAPYIDLSGNNPLIIPSFDPVGLKTDNVLGPQLTSLSKNWNGTANYEDSVFRVNDSKVWIDIIVIKGQFDYVLNLVQTPDYGMTDFIPNGGQEIITGLFPIANLDKLNALGAYISYCRPVFPPKKNSGLVTSNGDIAQRSDFVRNGYNVSGENVTVGVLSDSYNNLGLAAADVANDDLPGNSTNPDPVVVLQDYPATILNKGTDEGRAMLQIVHDIAPKAKLAFRTGFISEGDFALGVRQLADNANCNVIIDDITYITEPFFRDGFVAQSANYVRDHGKVYISAAGNYGTQAYSANFNPVPAPSGLTGYAHNFSTGGTDIYQQLSFTPGIYTIVLQWDNDFYSLGQANPSPNDLDAYLVDNNGAPIFGMNTNNFHKDPIEVLSFQVLGNTTANIMVVSANGSTNVKFKYIILRGGAQIMEYNTGSSTIVGQANADGALTVGAARYTRTPAYGITPPQIESFSSVGGTPVNGVMRNKPDFTAPDGGNTTVDLGSPLNLEPGESPVFPNFFGTSAAAPHAGGVVALLLSGSQKFRGTGMAPSEVKSLLQSTAIDMDASGFDNVSGAGFIQADAAMRTFASTTPILSSITLPSAITSETDQTFTITLQGQFFNSNSVVYLRDQPLTTTIVNSTLATAVVPGFMGNPIIRVYTPPISITLKDGGFSNSIKLLDIAKKKVYVRADNKSKLYGESIPTFTATVLVDSIPLADAGLTLSQLGLDGGRLQFSTPANALSDVTNYKITPLLSPALDTTNAADKALDELYTYIFTDGVLSINKLPLTITPNDKTITYGDSIVGVTYRYDLGSSQIPLNNLSTIQNNLVLEHQTSVINNTIALVDGKSISSGFAFSNLGFIASGKSISSGKTIVSGKSISSNFNVIELSPDIFNNYLPTGSNLVNGKSISSGKSIVSGKSIISGKSISSSSAIFNSSVGDSASSDNTIVILDQEDVNAGEVSTFTPINLITGLSVGQSDIIPGAFFTADFFSRNFDIHYGKGKLTINPAGLTIKAKDTSKVYGGIDPTLSYTVSGLKYFDAASVVTGVTLTTTTGANATAGQHPIIPSGGSAPNYTLNYVQGTLTVAKAPLSVKVNDATRIYGDPNPPFTFTYTGFVYTDNISSITTPPSVSTASQTANVGIYDITPSGGSAANYTFTPYLKGKLTITPASLNVKADDKITYAGDKSPSFSSTYTGFKNADNPTNTFSAGPYYSLSPDYSGKAGIYTITPYGIVQKQSPNNYNIGYETGILYVNPKGNGAKNIDIYLDCVDTLINDPGGFTYVAHFAYNNPNITTIEVPLGSDNNISSSGSYSGEPPTSFPPGVGHFSVYFLGQKVQWTLTTYNGNQKTAIASYASSTSAKCSAHLVSAYRPSNVQETLDNSGKLNVYPNPAHNKATLFVGTDKVSLNDIVIIDVTGRIFRSVDIKKSSSQTVELNLTSLHSGIYFIKVNIQGQPKLFKIEKF